MKKFIIFLVMYSILQIANGQSTSQKDLKSGNYYLKIQNKNDFTGKWVSYDPGKEIELYITANKTRQKYSGLDYYTDAIYIKVKKYMFKGKDIASSFIDPINLISSTSKNAYTYSGFNRDTVTSNIVENQLKLVQKGMLIMTNKLPWFLPENIKNDNTKGTVFYDKIILKRKE